MKLTELRFDPNWTFGESAEGSAIQCPICGTAYTQSVGEPASVAGWTGRGHAVSVQMECEPHSHVFAVLIGFHKGVSYIALQIP